MKKKTHEHCKVSIPERRYQPLRLAVAAVTLGMSIGISPIDVLASSKYSVSEEESPASVQRPGAEFPKVQRPGAEFPKVERPGAEFPKVERPGAEFPKARR